MAFYTLGIFTANMFSQIVTNSSISYDLLY